MNWQTTNFRFGILSLVIVSFFALPLRHVLLAQHSVAEQVSQQTCIAIVTPIVQGVPGSATDAAVGLRELMASYLRGPSIKVIELEAKLPSQAVEEAKQKSCMPMLVLTLTRKAAGGRGFIKALGRGASVASRNLPGSSTTASAAAHAGAAASLQTVSSLAESTRTKDEVRLEYQLQSEGGRVELGPKTERQVAKADGEDLLTPLIMRAAQAIVDRKAPK